MIDLLGSSDKVCDGVAQQSWSGRAELSIKINDNRPNVFDLGAYLRRRVDALCSCSHFQLTEAAYVNLTKMLKLLPLVVRHRCFHV